jgi:uncharacterized protein DUF4432
MPTEHRVLTDVSNNVWQDGAEFCGELLPLSGVSNWSVRQRRLRGGLSDGVDVVEIDNGALKVDILPTRGMGLWRGSFAGIPIGWNSPVKLPVHPAFVNLDERGGLGWLAGFNELLCRCGLAFNGPPGWDTGFEDNPIQGELTLHGKIANLPAHFVDLSLDPDSGRIAVTGVIDECSMFGPCLRLVSTIETTVGSNRCAIIDEITNVSAKPAEFQLLYHTNIGRPFLEPGARFLAPTREMCPRDARSAQGIGKFDCYEAPNTDYAEQAYYFRLAGDVKQQTLAMLRNAAGDLGLSLRFSLAEAPCFTLWKNTQADQDAYVTGLEPGTNFPNLRGFERQQGRVTRLAPGASYCIRLELAIHSGKSSVQEVAAEIERLQNTTTLAVSPRPLPEFSPAEK